MDPSITRSANGRASATVPSLLPPSTTITSAPRARSGASACSVAAMIAASSSTGMTMVSHPMERTLPIKPQSGNLACTGEAFCMENPVLVEVMRGPLVESRHRGAVAVSDAEGQTVLAIGDVTTPIFPRSAVKALQALPLIEQGAAERFGLAKRN